VRYASAVTVLFDIDAAGAQALAPVGFTVVEQQPGRTQCALALVDYRDSDLEAYHEIGTILFVRPDEGGPDGTFITHLPVDQEFTCAAGRAIWGYPKSLTRIDVTGVRDAQRWTLTMDGEFVLDITLPLAGGQRLPEAMTELTSYTVRDGVRCVTEFSQGGAGSTMTLGGGDIDLALGRHPVAKELSELGLPCPPQLTIWTEQMRATFGDARPLPAEVSG
jgi:Acetoacetate decarboxylase (ADC)